jgi:phage/conjugal plasmid C-4 type zinc finger TraR family protein
MQTRTKTNDRVRRLLKAELDAVVGRLHTVAEVPGAGGAGGDFLDVAQGIELQELAGLNASRLTERARRLRSALTRVSDGQYGICSECGTSIPPKRLLAIPDVTTCVACQQQLERGSRQAFEGERVPAGQPSE